ncbi:MAG TPA: fatty acid desaturase [Thermoanaerobaculia bacterium]|nr:fatty acid desaturase [Thermoanaerobaculia bacterium]
MHQTEALKAALSRGLEGEIAALRRFSPGSRALELLVFPLLWISGSVLVLSQPGSPSGFPSEYALRILGTLLAALGLNAFVLLLHEGMHGTLFPSRFWNRWISVLLGGCVLISFTAYRVMHEEHHRYLGDPRDPDEYRNYTSSPVLLWALHFVRLTVGCFLYILLIPVLAWRRGDSQDRRRIFEEYAILGAAWTAAFLLIPFETLLHGWLIPLVVVAYMTQIRGFTQHGITDPTDPLLASRSIHPGPLVRFLVLNENYHLEHHLYPEIPSYNLRKLHHLLRDRLPRSVTGSSYSGFLARFLRATWKRDDTPIGMTAPSGRK